ncbi:MAG: hypothetical protein CV087_24035 [Candidatus Brocadia sp. WS118]|nr:MAG: hypothetical protein CV087_24035 [Candidatus Brocadia sp. WS118]
MSLPDFLYKYMPFNNYTITNLKNQQLYFNKPSNFNDPFDCAMSLNQEPISEEEYLKLYFQYLNDERIKDKANFKNKYMIHGKVNSLFKEEVNQGIGNAFNQRMKVNRNERGICCFSEKNSDILMWSHYANGHKGFSLEFRTDFKLFKSAIKVEYSTAIPTVSPAKVLLNEENNETFIKMISTKFSCWKYEIEWRLMHVDGGDILYTYPKESLVGIYFGSEMLFAHKEIIALIIQGQNPDVKLYETVRSEEKFELSTYEVKYTRFIDKNS